MRKTLFGLLVGAAIVVGATAFLTSTPAVASACPRGSHLIQCPTYSFCCPNNAFCACFPG
jgi:hypothetical protein